LQRGYRFAIGLQDPGYLLRDYHTAQVAPKAALKGRPHATRRDELAIPKDKLSTILSTRDYRQDASCLVVVQALPDAPYKLAELMQALREPRHVLYLGRKSCPLAAPLFPQIVAADEVCSAFGAYINLLRERLKQAPRKTSKPASTTPAKMLPGVAPISQLIWSDLMPIACEPTFSITRKDRIISRQGWQFGDRIEHRAIISIGEEACISA
jgi:CRISPR system Cascade subunit CasD